MSSYNIENLKLSDIDDCVPNPCKNGSQCLDLPNDYSCICTAGYEGKICETSEWICCWILKVATCISLFVFNHNYKLCYITTLNSIANLITDINDCAPNSCKNGGTCIDLINGFQCSCADGFAGKNCTESKIYLSLVYKIYKVYNRIIILSHNRYRWLLSKSVPKWCHLQRFRKWFRMSMHWWIFWKSLW